MGVYVCVRVIIHFIVLLQFTSFLWVRNMIGTRRETKKMKHIQTIDTKAFVSQEYKKACDYVKNRWTKTETKQNETEKNMFQIDTENKA